MDKVTKFIYDKSKSIEVEKGYIVDNYLSIKDDVGYSIVRTHLDGKHPYMKNIKSNRTYYIIEGNGVFYFDKEIINLSKGEMLTIPCNTKYAFKGKFDAMLVDCPAFEVENDVIYDEEIVD